MKTLVRLPGGPFVICGQISERVCQLNIHIMWYLESFYDMRRSVSDKKPARQHFAPVQNSGDAFFLHLKHGLVSCTHIF